MDFQIFSSEDLSVWHGFFETLSTIPSWQGLKETKKAPVGKSEAKEDEPEKETNVPVSDKKEKEKDTAKEDENKEAKEKQKEEDLVEGVRDTIRSMYR